MSEYSHSGFVWRMEDSDRKHGSPITGVNVAGRVNRLPTVDRHPLAHPLYPLNHILYLKMITKIVRSVPTRLYAMAYLFPKIEAGARCSSVP